MVADVWMRCLAKSVALFVLIVFCVFFPCCFLGVSRWFRQSTLPLERREISIRSREEEAEQIGMGARVLKWKLVGTGQTTPVTTGMMPHRGGKMQGTHDERLSWWLKLMEEIPGCCLDAG